MVKTMISFMNMRIMLLSLDLWVVIETDYDDFDNMGTKISDQTITLKEKQ